MVKIWNVADEESEGVKGRKREISLATSRDLGVVSLSLVFSPKESSLSEPTPHVLIQYHYDRHQAEVLIAAP